MGTELWHFVRSFGGRWFIYMSGAPSVPLAIAAVLVEKTAVKIGLAVTAALCVFLAAFLAWREEYRKVINFTARLAPKVKVTTSSHLEPKEAINGFRTVRVVVENVSESVLKGCRVREKMFINVFDHASGMQRHFRLGEETYADMANHTYKQTFDLQGRGSTEITDIASLDETKDDSRVVMLYATTRTSHTLNAIVRECFPHRLTISITSDDMLIAEERTYDLRITDSGILELNEL
jgi:hypothetical protein